MELLRATTQERPIGVDREANVLRGFVLAQAGPFKTGRGEFDEPALKSIVTLAKAQPKGLKSRFTHPSESSDGLGKYLGRVKDVWLDKSTQPAKVRGDLHLDPTSFATPSGDLGSYVLNLAESDPDAFSSSLALRAGREYRLDKQGRQLTNDQGEPLPPFWRPLKLVASDLVDTGDAVDGLLSDAQPLNDEADEAIELSEQHDDTLSSLRARVQTRQRLL